MIAPKVNSLSLLPGFDLEPLRNWVSKNVLSASRDADRTEIFPIELYRELHQMGWMYSFVSAESGGAGLGVPELIWISRTLAYGSAGVFTTFVAHLLGMSPVLLYGSPALRTRLEKASLRELELWSYAMTEADTGSNIGQTRTRARRTADGYVINGAKAFITNATISRHLTVFARLDEPGETRPKLCVFYVPGDSPGLRRGKPLQKLGQRDSDTAELFFDNVHVPAEYRLGDEGQGLEIAFRCLQRSKTMIAAAAVGVCDRAGELARNHLAGREMYGGPLLRLPTVRHLIARMETQAQAAWLLTCLAAGTWQSGDRAVLEASMAKLFATDMAVHFVSEALELFGGYGFCREYEIEKLYRDVRVFEIYEGPTLIQEALIARELIPELKRPAQSERKAA